MIAIERLARRQLATLKKLEPSFSLDADQHRALQLLDELRDMITRGEIDPQRVIMSPRSTRGGVAYQSVSIWFAENA